MLAAVAAGWFGRAPLAGWQFQQAQRLFHRGEHEDAVHRLGWVVRIAPDKALASAARLLKAEILELQLNRPQQALLAYLTLVRDDPRSPQAEKALRQAARIYRNRLHDYGNALPLLQRLADAGVADADRIRYQIADCYFRLANYEQARIEFETLQKLYPQSPLQPEVSYRIGVALLLEGKPERAAEVFERTAKRWPDDRFALEALWSLAGIYERRDELVRARRLLAGLRGRYPLPELLEKRIGRIDDRIRRKKKAI